MYPLQIINDIEPLSLTLGGVNTHFIHHPSNVENYSIGHKSETDQPKQKILFWTTYFYTCHMMKTKSWRKITRGFIQRKIHGTYIQAGGH